MAICSNRAVAMDDMFFLDGHFDLLSG